MTDDPRRAHRQRVLELPVMGNLRQGTIFTGASCDGYDGCDVYGLVVTAQCDLAHDKARMINYLPVVSMRDWHARDFAILLAESVSRELYNKGKNYLKNCGVSPHLIDIASAAKIIEDVLGPRKSDRQIKKTIPKLEQTLRDLEFSRRAMQSHVTTVADLSRLIAVNRKLASALLARLAGHDLSGYYYLPAVDPEEDDSIGYVVLLRQVYHISLDSARKIAKGYKMNTQDGESHFAMPCGQIRPPFLEHLMQTFAYLFSRIGVRDVPVETTEILEANLPCSEDGE